jgi:hypothetical protein
MDNEESKQSHPEQEVETVSMVVPFVSSFVYSNASAYSMTFNDLKISFGEAMPNRVIEARVGVTVSIEHAAYIFFSLFNQLRAYEKNFGQIRYPEWQVIKQMLLAHEAAETTEGS